MKTTIKTKQAGVPIGGTTGQVLKKQSNADYDVAFGNEGGGGLIGNSTFKIFPQIVTPTTTSVTVSDKTLTTTDYIYKVDTTGQFFSALPVTVTIIRRSRFGDYFGSPVVIGSYVLNSFTGMTNPFVFLPIVYQNRIYISILNTAVNSGAENILGFIVIDGLTGANLGQTNTVIPTYAIGIGPREDNITSFGNIVFFNNNQVGGPTSFNAYKITITGVLTISLTTTYSTNANHFSSDSIKLQNSDLMLTNGNVFNQASFSNTPVVGLKGLGVTFVNDNCIVIDNKLTQLINSFNSPISHSEHEFVDNDSGSNF